MWKGTSEEKARQKWVREVEVWVEDFVTRSGGDGKDRNVEKKEQGEKRGEKGGKSVEVPMRTGSGAGFLRRLRDEIYME